MTSVQVTTLPGGLRVATDTMPGVESVAVGVWIGVGARAETAAENGLTHLLEHMAFKGTDTRTATGIAEEIEAVGGHLNAYTSREVTAYYARVLRADLPLALDILADILQRSSMDAEELERERSVILQEIGQALDMPEDVAFDLFQETAYPDQPVGRPILGTPQTLEVLTRDDVRGFMKDRYRAGSMVVSAAGAVDHDDFVRRVEALFADLPTGETARTERAAYGGGERRDARKSEQVHLLFGLEGVHYEDPDFHAFQVLSALYGGGMSSRLFQEVRERRGLVYSIYSFASSLTDSGVLGVYAGTGAKEAETVMQIVCDELRGLASGCGEAEVSRAQAQLRSSILMARESTTNRCEQLAQQLLIYGKPLDPRETVEQVDAVGRADIGRIVQRLLTSEPALTLVGPGQKVSPLESWRARLTA